MVNQEASMTLEQALGAEAWVQAECMAHPDYGEAHRAFVEKRPADFAKNPRRLPASGSDASRPAPGAKAPKR